MRGGSSGIHSTGQTRSEPNCNHSCFSSEKKEAAGVDENRFCAGGHFDACLLERPSTGLSLRGQIKKLNHFHKTLQHFIVDGFISNGASVMSTSMCYVLVGLGQWGPWGVTWGGQRGIEETSREEENENK